MAGELPTSAGNRRAWDVASRKYVEEDEATLALARAGTLLPAELELLGGALAAGAVVVHLQSGNGTDDFALLAAGASCVIGVDFSAVTAGAAAGRARRAGVAASYAVADVGAVALRPGVADLVYTGKGSLVWVPDLERWAGEVVRLLRPGGACFVYDEHPAAPLWSTSPSPSSFDYFGGTRPNTSFPASAIARFGGPDEAPAIEHQWPLSAVVAAVLSAGLVIRHLGEHAEPFWRPADGSPPSPSWDGSLPNSFSLLAVRPGG